MVRGEGCGRRSGWLSQRRRIGATARGGGWRSRGCPRRTGSERRDCSALRADDHVDSQRRGQHPTRPPGRAGANGLLDGREGRRLRTPGSVEVRPRPRALRPRAVRPRVSPRGGRQRGAERGPGDRGHRASRAHGSDVPRPPGRGAPRRRRRHTRDCGPSDRRGDRKGEGRMAGARHPTARARCARDRARIRARVGSAGSPRLRGPHERRSR